jgi:O-antigen/teichoic acid export membrane protein
MAYYAAILVSNCLAIIAGLFILAPALKRVPLTGMVSLMKEIFRFGTYVQVANIFQALNYRLSLKFVDHFLGRSAVGVLSLGMQLAEGLWLISRSMATVQYSRIANQMDEQYSIRLTLTLIKISFVVTALAMLVVLAIPASVFTTVFSARFGEVKLVITSLSAGIVVLSVSMVLSGFFSGINKPWHNMVSSAIGVVFTVVLGLVLIPRFGIAGAGFAATCSYGAVTLYQFLVFASIAKIRLSDLLITRSEVQRFIRELKQNMPSRS